MITEAMILKAAALLVTVGLECPNPDVQMKEPNEMPMVGGQYLWGAFLNPDATQGRMTLWISKGVPEHMRFKILVHEMLHCGHWDMRAHFKQRQPAAMDGREEQVTQAQTDWLLGTTSKPE